MSVISHSSLLKDLGGAEMMKTMNRSGKQCVLFDYCTVRLTDLQQQQQQHQIEPISILSLVIVHFTAVRVSPFYFFLFSKAPFCGNTLPHNCDCPVCFVLCDCVAVCLSAVAIDCQESGGSSSINLRGSSSFLSKHFAVVPGPLSAHYLLVPLNHIITVTFFGALLLLLLPLNLVVNYRSGNCTTFSLFLPLFILLVQ